MDFFSFHIYTSCRVIDLQISVDINAGFFADLLAVVTDTAKGNPQTCQQFLHRERFGQIVISSCIQSLHFIGILAPCRHDDDRHIAPGTYFPYDLHTVHVRKSQIQEHNVRAVGQGVHHRAGSVAGFPVLVILKLQCRGDQIADRRVIFYD